MSQEQLKLLFSQVGAIVTGSHIVYAKKETGWHHGAAYINKDVISQHPKLLAMCAREIVRMIGLYEEQRQGFLRIIEVVAAPAAGAVGWGQILAHHLCDFAVLDPRFVFAEKAPHPTDPKDHVFEFRAIHQQAIKGKGVLIAEDITNPGTSVKKVGNAVEACGGKVIGVAVLANRAGKKAHECLNPWPLFAVADINMEMWHEDECPLCQQGIALDMTLGKAKDWLATEKGQAWKKKHNFKTPVEILMSKGGRI